MNIFESIFLGLVQGITEFIPVSSSGHLELAQQILGSSPEDFHYFLELINFGTLLALIIFFRHRIIKILGDIFRRRNFHMLINLLLTVIPAGVIGLLLSDIIDSNGFFSSLYTISIAMALIGLVMVMIDKLPHLSKLKNDDKLTHPRALTIGLAQTFALIPGVSRSGSTNIAGRIMGLDSKSAANYSFLASIPLMTAVCLKSLVSSSSRAYIADNLGLLALSNLVAFIAGMIAISFIMKFLAKPKSLQAFGYYRIILGSIVLILLLIQ